jgi:hypothetical protein
MEKEFVTYELALRMKQLGFDEKCIMHWWKGKLSYYQMGDFSPTHTSAPTFSQAFRWFREKYSLMGSVCEDVDGNFSLWTNKGNLLLQGKEYKEYKTYEEAELECLKKLLEIVEGKES